MTQLAYIGIGLITGLLAGSLGIGGGIVIVPLLVYGFGLTQHQAQGTSLAIMIPPITLLAALRYYYSGNVKLNMAAFIAAGFAIGGLVGASLIQKMPEIALRRIFGGALLLTSLKMLFF
ncbi:MAG: sulfite exporter TauE/SafE family protein [Candidatus Omnitrophica bacterium]|nr:sulfite exporter TauE/SafE family protein [Candidatus Omnitrophota bacterium]